MRNRVWLCALWLVPIVTLVAGSWGEPGQSQYHIQTDEGPERYFRFQTDNGQFRKERRLQDGTVIGTEAWIDAAGYLRQKDYIADKQGYRILKSKTIFVGQGRHVQDAIKSTKAAPAQSGVLVDGSSGLNSVTPTTVSRQSIRGDNSGGSAVGYDYTTTSRPTPVELPVSILTAPLTSGAGKLKYLPPSEAARIKPSTQLGFDHYPDELPRAYGQLQAGEDVIDTTLTQQDVDNSILAYEVPNVEPNVAPPVLSMQPPFARTHTRRLRPVAVLPSTVAPISAHESLNFNYNSEYSTPAPFTRPTVSSAAPFGYRYPTTTSAPQTSDLDGYDYYTPSSPFEVNNLDRGLLPPLPASAYRRRLRPVHSNKLDAPEYDGVSTTRNGFRYVLPRQYHEEAQVNEKRAGSFGYVDPFGIRRVVYYNASPQGGFVHRNNNQFVGLGGTPYDDPGPVNDDV